MALPSVGGGRQIGDGNVSEPVLGVQGTPGAATGDATLTVAQLLSGILVGNPSTSAAAYTLPTVASLEATLVNAKIDSTVTLQLINLGTSSGVITLTTNTGWTLVGRAAVPITTGVTLIARKTGATTWTLYIVG